MSGSGHFKSFSWAKGSRFGKGAPSAVAVVGELGKIGVAPGSATADDVLRQAENPSSCMHCLFEWDDEVAAYKFRLTQAREILRSIKVTITKPNGKEVTTRYYVNVTHGREDTREPFYTITMVLADKRLRRMMLEQALKELEGWRQRYAELVELTMVFRVIDRALAKKKTARGRRTTLRCRKGK